jgi:hypothetical protein
MDDTVMTKIYTGLVPFDGDGYANDPQVIMAILRGIRPKRPYADKGMTEELWELVTRCWQANPDSRPEMQEVVETVRIASDFHYLNGTNIN